MLPSSQDEIVSSGEFYYDIEYFYGSDFGTWWDSRKPQDEYFKATLEITIEDVGSEYIITYSHREHFRFVPRALFGN